MSVRVEVHLSARLLRESLASLLSADGRWHAVAVEPGTADASKQRRGRVDAVVTDLRGRASAPSAPVLLVIAGQGDNVGAGATLVCRERGVEGVLEALASGEVPGEAAAPGGRDRAPALLTEREGRVLACLADGRTVKQVAERLSISPKTVDNHKQRIYTKLGARNLAHAVSLAHELGLTENVSADDLPPPQP